jgi:GT2 family glycosyltransferase
VAGGFTVQSVEADVSVSLRVYANREAERIETPLHDIRRLPKADRDMVLRAEETEMEPEAPTILLQLPHALGEWGRYSDGPRIGLTMIESDGIRAPFVRAMRSVDLLCAPSEYVAQTFRWCVPHVPVNVLPLPADPALWRPRGPRMRIEGRPRFLFGSVFSVCARKHWDILLEAFTQEFAGEDVGLVLKCDHPGYVEQCARWSRRRGAWVAVVQQHWTQAKMAAMYREIDCYVLPAAEGFGMPFVEAALCGTASVALDRGGQADVVTPTTGYPVPSHMEPCQNTETWLLSGSHRWPTCTVGSLRAVMRDAMEGERSSAARWPVALDTAREKWTPQAIGPLLQSVVEQGAAAWERSQTTRTLTNPSRQAAPDLTCVILTRDHRDLTVRCIQTLRASHHRSRVIVVDDGSTDDTPTICAHLGCEVLRVPPPHGNISRNANMAASLLSSGEWLCLLNNDVEFTDPFWWAALWSVMEEENGCGIMSPTKLLPTGQLQNVGNRVLQNGRTVSCDVRRRYVPVDYVETACAIVRPECRADLDPLGTGLFDADRYPLWYGDVDLAQRAWRAGWEVAASAAVSVVHHASATSGSRKPETIATRRVFMRQWRESL